MIKKIIFSSLLVLTLTSENFIQTTSLVDEYDYQNYTDYKAQIAHYDTTHISDGTPIYGTIKSEDKIVKYVENWVWGNQYKSYDTLAYAIYHVGICNAAYYSEPIGYIESGYVEETYTKTLSTTYEESLKKTLSTSVSQSTTAGTNYNAISGKISAESEINNKVETETKVSNQAINTKSKTVHFNITTPGYYSYDLRAIFDMYIVQVYNINYLKNETRTEKSGLWVKNHYYEYDIIGYYLKESYVTYSLKNDLGLCITKYKYDDSGNKIYDGPKENDSYIYF